MELGRLGVWTFLDNMSAGAAATFARRIETLGYTALWIPEAIGRDFGFNPLHPLQSPPGR